MARPREDAKDVRPLPVGLLPLVGPAEYSVWRRVGEDCLGLLLEACLPRRGRVLEIGCGVGRIAWPLARALGPRASYLGVDVRAETVEFCRERIAPGDPRFRFKHVDLRLPAYNPGGRRNPARWRPSKLGRFDFVLLISVLTHLNWEDSARYLRELRGLLAPGGRAFITFFLHSPELLRARGPRFDGLFPYRAGESRFGRRGFLYSHSERSLLAACAESGLALARPILHGDWSAAPLGRGSPPQDVVVLRAAAPKRRGQGK
jgi:SAM-dependent methyltransferase